MDDNVVQNLSTHDTITLWHQEETQAVDTHLIFCIQYIPRNVHMVFALLCFVVVMHWLIFPYPSGLLHWHCGNLTIAPVPAKQPWWIWINTSCEFIMNDCITTTKQRTTKPCAYFLGYTVGVNMLGCNPMCIWKIKCGWQNTQLCLHFVFKYMTSILNFKCFFDVATGAAMGVLHVHYALLCFVSRYLPDVFLKFNVC